MITDKCVPTNVLTYLHTWIWLRQQKPFLCLLRIKHWLLTALEMKIQYSSNHLHHVCTNASAHTCWKWSHRAFSLSISVQILIAEPLDKWLKKSYNTTTLMGWRCESDHISWQLIFTKNDPLPMMPKPSIWERIFTTTYATIDTIGVPGDKMPRERERSFLP